LQRPRNTRAAATGIDNARRWTTTFLSALVLLLLVLDPFGSLPVFICGHASGGARTPYPCRAARVGLAFGVLLAFMLAGQAFLSLMRLSERSLEVAGGVILLIIAMRMIFAAGGELYGRRRRPGAADLPARGAAAGGPSAMATVLLLASRQPERLCPGSAR
jgi:small neutral amino acid transporter SnatA (MarC family)